MYLIDTHTHIYDTQFSLDRNETIQRALEAGVKMMLMPNVDASTIAPMLELHQKYPDCTRVMMGLQPEEVKEDYKEVLSVMEKELSDASPASPVLRSQSSAPSPSSPVLSPQSSVPSPQSPVPRPQSFVPRPKSSVSRPPSRVHYVGVGEVGLDFYWDASYEKQQLDAFETQLDWAKQLSLPLSIHCRNAFDKMVHILEKKQDGDLRGIMHCFTGTEEEAKVYLDLGFHLGLGGVTTYKNCSVKEFLPNLPLDRIVLETDAPYLAPVPCRGKRNEPAFLVHTAQKIAEILQIPVEELAEATTKNVQTMFQL